MALHRRLLRASLLAVVLLAFPLALAAFTICNQYHESAGDCTHICDFYGPSGQRVGYAEWRGACE